MCIIQCSCFKNTQKTEKTNELNNIYLCESVKFVNENSWGYLMADYKEKKSYSFNTILHIGVLVCILFLLISVTIFKYKLNQEFEARCDKIRVAGEPVSFQELAEFYGEVPDEENAALIYEDVFALYKNSDDVYDMYIKEATAKGITKDKLEFQTKEAFKNNILSLGCDINVITDEKKEQKVKDATRIFLNANKSCIELSRKLEQYSKCQFYLDFNKGLDMYLLHLTPSRDFTRLLAVDINYAAFIGDSDRVLKDFRKGMKLGKSLSQEPILISYLVGVAIDNIMINALKKSYSRIKFTDEQLKEIADIIKEHIKSITMYRAYIGERVYSLTGIDFLGKYTKLTKFEEKLFKLPHLFGVVLLWKLKLLDFFDELFKIERVKDFRKKKKLLDALQKKYKNLPFLYKPIKIVCPEFFSNTEFDYRAMLTSALIAIEVERYRLKYHKLPKDLNKLVPEFFQKLPIDPYSGKPYKYRVGKFEFEFKETYYHSIKKIINAFVVYSIGANGVDNKGKDNYRRGDIVYWIMER